MNRRARQLRKRHARLAREEGSLQHGPEPSRKLRQTPEQKAESLLGHLAYKGREHLRKHLPNWFRTLVEENRLAQHLLQAERSHAEMMHQLLNGGYRRHEAEEVVNPMFLFPPGDQWQAEQREWNETQDDVEAILERRRILDNQSDPA